MRAMYFIAIFFLLFLSPTYPQLIRAPLFNRPRANTTSGTKTRKLSSSFSDSMEIENYYNTQYAASISLGSDSQEFTFALDTGSATMWVPGTSYSAGSSGNYFQCSSSSTCRAFVNDQESVFYGQGEVFGYKIQDQIQLGDLVIPEFDILLATDVGDMSGANFDGLIGLGSTRDPNTNFPTVLENLKQYNLISVGMFSMYLGYDPSSSGSNTGEIIFGGYDPEYAISDFQFVNIKTGGDIVYWQAEISAIGYGSSQNLSFEAQPIIFDSGTSLMLLSEDILNRFLNQARAQGVTFSYDYLTSFYTCDCSAQSTLDSLTFYFNGSNFSIPASSYIYEQDGTCNLAISSQSGDISDSNPMILGDAFLSNYYALYTVDNSTVGLALAAPVKHFPVWLIIVIVLSALAIIALGVYLFMRWRKKKKLQQERLLNEENGENDSYYGEYNDANY